MLFKRHAKDVAHKGKLNGLLLLDPLWSAAARRRFVSCSATQKPIAMLGEAPFNKVLIRNGNI